MGPKESLDPWGNAGGGSEDRGLDPIAAGMMRDTKVIASLDLRRGLSADAQIRPDSLVLTDSQLVHVGRSARRMASSVVSVRDVCAATVESERRGPSEYAWGALAVLLGLALWRVLENPLVSAIAGAIVAAIGVYLIADKLLSPMTSVVVVVSEEGARLRCPLKGAAARADTYDFISRVYMRKSELERMDAHAALESGASRARYSNRVFRGD